MSKEIAIQNKKLAAYEKQIDKNIKAAWYENGLIMLKIRDENLYKEKYTTFENYLNERWDYDRTRGYQLINAAELTQKLSLQMTPEMSKIFDKTASLSVSILPEKENQTKVLLTGLKTDSERAKVWADVVEDSKNEDRKITAAYVQQKVDEFVASGEVVEEIDFDELKRKHDEAIAAKKAAALKPQPVAEKPAKINIESKPEEVKTGFVQIDAKELENIEDSMHELASLNKSISKDNDSMSRVFDANDKLAAATKEIARLNSLNTSLEGRLNGFMNERNALIKEAKYWRAKFEKLEKSVVANG